VFVCGPMLFHVHAIERACQLQPRWIDWTAARSIIGCGSADCRRQASHKRHSQEPVPPAYDFHSSHPSVFEVFSYSTSGALISLDYSFSISVNIRQLGA
jgi:hypothetical protein